MSDAVPKQDLPQFERPPVVEIVGAAQFLALPQLELRDIVAVGQALTDFDLEDLGPEIPPMHEAPPGSPEAPGMAFSFGPAPYRALFAHREGRFAAQIQRDRVAINERRRDDKDEVDPSSAHVWPELERFAHVVSDTLVEHDNYGPRRPTFVELTYVNVITPAPGVWEDHTDVHRVLRIVATPEENGPFSHAERVGVRFSFPLFSADHSFNGRLHAAADPVYTAEGPVLNLKLFSRRIVQPGAGDLAEVFDTCHRDVVNGFVALTTPEMHDVWERSR